MGLYRSTGDVGFVIGPPLLGYIADQSSFSVALAVNAGLAICAGLLFMFARETVQRSARPARTVDSDARADFRTVEGGDR